MRHRVEPGQTLYRIARTYGLSPEALASANGIRDARSVSVGQELVIPGATQRLNVPGPGEPIPAPPPAPPSRPAEVAAAPAQAADYPEAASVPLRTGRLALAASAEGRPLPPAPAAPSRPAPAKAESVARAPAPARAAAGRAFTSRRPGHLQWPLRGVLYGRYGKRGGELHDGIDLAAPAGTPVKTADVGTVLFAGVQRGYGNIVIVEHKNGIITLYAHNRDVRVRTGQEVREGQVLATVGDSGKTSGPHLHFEVRVDGKPVDPLQYLGPIPERV